MAGRGEPPALDRRQMPAHAIHLADRRARLQQRAVDGLLVFEREAVQRRNAAATSRRRRSGEHEIVGGEAADRVEDAASRRRRPPRRAPDAPLRRSRCARTAPRSRSAVTTRPVSVARPMVLDRLRHRRRRLAGADHDEPAFGRRRQMRRQATRRLRRVDRGVEHACATSRAVAAIPSRPDAASTRRLWPSVRSRSWPASPAPHHRRVIPRGAAVAPRRH